MGKALVLGSSVGSSDIVSALKGRGVYTIVTDYYPTEQSRAKQIADEAWEISTADLDELERRCKEEGVMAVFAGVSEFNIERSIELCDRLGLPNPSAGPGWDYSRDKRMFKELCEKIGVPIPDDYRVSSDMTDEEIDAIKYPVVVKPIDQSGNKGVSYCGDKAELIQACEHARSISSKAELIVERMIDGDEWYGYYAVAEGEASLICLFAMYAEPGFPKNIYSMTTSITGSARKYAEEIDPDIKRLIKEAGCQDGIVWIQVMLDKSDERFYAIEMGYRLDGGLVGLPAKDLSRFDSIEWIVDGVLGRPHMASELPAGQVCAYEGCASTYTFWVDKACTLSEISGIEEIKDGRVHFDIHAKPGDAVRQYGSVGIAYFSTDEVDETISIIRQINEALKVIDSEGEDVLIRYTDYDRLRSEYDKGRCEA